MPTGWFRWTHYLTQFIQGTIPPVKYGPPDRRDGPKQDVKPIHPIDAFTGILEISQEDFTREVIEYCDTTVPPADLYATPLLLPQTNPDSYLAIYIPCPIYSDPLRNYRPYPLIQPATNLQEVSDVIETSILPTLDYLTRSVAFSAHPAFGIDRRVHQPGHGAGAYRQTQSKVSDEKVQELRDAEKKQAPYAWKPIGLGADDDLRGFMWTPPHPDHRDFGENETLNAGSVLLVVGAPWMFGVAEFKELAEHTQASSALETQKFIPADALSALSTMKYPSQTPLPPTWRRPLHKLSSSQSSRGNATLDIKREPSEVSLASSAGPSNTRAGRSSRTASQRGASSPQNTSSPNRGRSPRGLSNLRGTRSSAASAVHTEDDNVASATGGSEPSGTLAASSPPRVIAATPVPKSPVADWLIKVIRQTCEATNTQYVIFTTSNLWSFGRFSKPNLPGSKIDFSSLSFTPPIPYHSCPPGSAPKDFAAIEGMPEPWSVSVMQSALYWMHCGMRSLKVSVKVPVKVEVKEEDGVKKVDLKRKRGADADEEEVEAVLQGGASPTKKTKLAAAPAESTTTTRSKAAAASSGAPSPLKASASGVSTRSSKKRAREEDDAGTDEDGDIVFVGIKYAGGGSAAKKRKTAPEQGAAGPGPSTTAARTARMTSGEKNLKAKPKGKGKPATVARPPLAAPRHASGIFHPRDMWSAFFDGTRPFPNRINSLHDLLPTGQEYVAGRHMDAYLVQDPPYDPLGSLTVRAVSPVPSRRGDDEEDEEAAAAERERRRKAGLTADRRWLADLQMTGQHRAERQAELKAQEEARRCRDRAKKQKAETEGYKRKAEVEVDEGEKRRYEVWAGEAEERWKETVEEGRRWEEEGKRHKAAFEALPPLPRRSQRVAAAAVAPPAPVPAPEPVPVEQTAAEKAAVEAASCASTRGSW